MPIKDKSLYPPDWKHISRRIRDRAGNKCEWCGAPNGEYIVRETANPISWHVVSLEDDRILNPTAKKAIKVVLTCAHIDHDPANNSDDNLASLCQRCHLRHDIAQHTANAAATRRRKHNEATGQMELF